MSDTGFPSEYGEAHLRAYYYLLRLEAREAVVKDLLRRIREKGGAPNWMGYRLASLTRQAIDYAKEHWPRSDHLTDGFSAREREHRFFTTMIQPSHFGVAVWQVTDAGELLHGIAMGRTSNNKKSLTLNWIERSFAAGFPKGGILLPVLACAEEYAKLLEAQTVFIRNPVDATELSRYGYRPVRRSGVAGDYLCKDLSKC